MASNSNPEISALEAQIKILQLQLEITHLKAETPVSGIQGMNNPKPDSYAAAVAIDKLRSHSYNPQKMVQLGKPTLNITSTTDNSQGKRIATPPQTASGKEQTNPLMVNILPKDMTLSKGQPSMKDSASSSKSKSQKPKGKRQHVNQTAINQSFRPENSPKTKDWKPSSQKPVTSHQLELLSYLFRSLKSPDTVRKVEKEFAKLNQMNNANPIHQTNWPISKISFPSEINEELKIDAEMPLEFSVFQKKIFPRFFTKMERSITIENAIYRSFDFKGFQNCFSKLAHDKQLEEKMVFNRIAYDAFINYIGFNTNYLAGFIIKQAINSRMFSELFDEGFIQEIHLNPETMDMIKVSTVPYCIKEFVQFIYLEDKQNQSIKVISAAPSYEYYSWSTYYEAQQDGPKMNCPIWIIMESYQDSHLQLAKARIEPTRDTMANRRAAGLQLIYQAIIHPEYYAWKDAGAIQLMAFHSEKRTSIIDYFQTDGILEAQSFKPLIDDTINYFSEDDNTDKGKASTEEKTMPTKKDASDKAKVVTKEKIPTSKSEVPTKKGDSSDKVDQDSPNKG